MQEFSPETASVEPPIPEQFSERQSARWDLQNAGGNYAVLIAAQVVSAFFALASVWLLTNYAGADGYGWIIAIIAASQLAQVFVNWTAVSLARYGVQEFVEDGRITASFWARTILFLPNTILLLLTSFLWLPFVSSWLKLPPEIFWLVLAHFVLSGIWIHVQYAIQAAKLPRLQGLMLAAERILIFIILAALLFGGAGPFTAIIAYIVSPAVMSIAGLVLIRKLVSWRMQIDLETIKKLFRFSVPLIPYSLVGYFSTNALDAIFISQYLSKHELGVYSIAYQISGMVMQFPILAGSLLFPLFITLRSTGKEVYLQKYMEDLVPLVTFVGAVGSIIAAIVIKITIPIVFGGKADDAVIVFWILASSSVLGIPIIMGFSPFLNAVSASTASAVVALAAAAANLIGNYLLIPRYGIAGCAWATVLSYGASVLIIIIIGRVWFSLRHRWTIPACIPVLTCSIYATVTGDLLMAALIGLTVAALIILIFRKAARDGVRIFMDYRAFVNV